MSLTKLSCESTGAALVTYCTFLVALVLLVATIVTMTHLGYVALLVAFLALLVLRFTVSYLGNVAIMLPSQLVARSFPQLRVLVGDVMCVNWCCSLKLHCLL